MEVSLDALSGMSEELRQGILRAAAVLKAAGAREVYLFGSAAQGKLREGSDIDLAVAGLPPGVFFWAIGEACDALGSQIDLVDLDQNTTFVRYLREHEGLRRVG